MPEIDWNDPDLATMKTRESNWYRVKPGNRDVIQIVSKIAKIRKHTYSKNGKFFTQMCSREEHGTCPYCSRLPKDPTISDHRDDQDAFACAVLHIARQRMEADAKPKAIVKLLAWRFGDDKKSQLMELWHLSGKNLTGHQLSVALKGDGADDEKFQKLNINLLPKPMNLSGKLAEQAKIQLAKFPEIRELYFPSPEDLSKFIKADDNAQAFEPAELDAENAAFSNSMEDPVTQKPKPQAKKATPKKVQPEEESALDELDDPLEGMA